jgi:hypothetical protein
MVKVAIENDRSIATVRSGLGFIGRALGLDMAGNRQAAYLARGLRRRRTAPFAVNGPAAGGGFALALAADLRICAPGASFVASVIRLGLSGGDVGASLPLPRLVGAGVAADILMTGRKVDAGARRRGTRRSCRKRGGVRRRRHHRVVGHRPGGRRVSTDG